MRFEHRSLLVFAAMSAASCFSPNPPTGAECAQPGTRCPPGLECFFGRCELPGVRADAGENCPWRSQNLEPCTFTSSSAELLLDSDHQFDSDELAFETFVPDDGVVIETLNLGSVEAALILADEIRITPSATLRVIGSRPVIFAAFTSIKIEGDVNAGSNAIRGAGGSPANCADGAADRSAGGAGGSQTTNLGGNGGDSENGTTGGAPTNPSADVALQGGCQGMEGGTGSGSGQGGRGGHGGGALYLSAAALIEISGRIEAGGGGGIGGGSGEGSGSAHPGGGGGGAGGHVILESPQVMLLQALVAANGGGGGGGSADSASGQSGMSATASTLGGGGGMGAGNGGGDGGDGGDSIDCSGGVGQVGQVGQAETGGGGGGGACGRFDVYTDDLTQSAATLSPGPTTFDLP